MLTIRLTSVVLQCLLVLLTGGISVAQHVCGTPHLTDAEMMGREKIIRSKTLFRSARQSTTMQYIPIRFHVLRRDNGTGGASVSSLNQAIVLLNQLYQPAGIAFYQCGSQPHYIDNTTFFDFDKEEEASLADGNDVFNAINIYLTNTIIYNGSQVSGYAYYPSSLAIANRIFLEASQVTGYSMAHEMGHYFDLYHTFQNNRSSTVTNRELVLRPGTPQGTRPFAANCELTGDFVCDTPSDPYGIPGATTSGCTYTGTVIDANGDPFTPHTSNIMSYYACGNQFTPGQYARIETGLLYRLDPGNEYNLDCATIAIAAPTDLSVTMQSTGALVQFLYTATDAAGFLIERAIGTTGSFTVVGSLPPASFSFVDGSVVSNTMYTYRVKASNATTQYSTEQSVNTGLFYCRPTYTFPIANFFPKIDDFMLKSGGQSTLNSVATGAGSAGYSDFTGTAHSVLPGQTYSFTASAITGNSGSYVFQHLTIWLDSNRDGVFSSTEALFSSSAGQLMSPAISSTIVIPSTVTTGLIRLRLRSQYAADGVVTNPCAAYNYGETEDYTLLIMASVQAPCFSLSASTTAVSCANGQDGRVGLVVSGGGGPFSYSLANQSNTTGLFTNLPPGSYTATAAAATGGCSSSLTITIGQPAPNPNPVSLSPTNATSCTGQSVTLTASGGSAYLWNTGQTGASLQVFTSGTYSVTTTSAAGCTSVAGTLVTMVSCTESVLAKAKVLLEGFTDPATGLMNTTLTLSPWFPTQQPYSALPWSYTGTESVTTIPANVTDWILIMGRTAQGEVLVRKAGFIRNDGMLLSTDGSEGILLPPTSEPICVSIHHRSHLAVITSNTVTSGQLVDLTTSSQIVKGNSQLKQVGSWLTLYVGDYNGNNVINNADYNMWRTNASTIGNYLPVDSDGNGIINNRDYNRWTNNRSKIGTPDL
ncbi:GEVED domain-containing protein [Fibrella aquatica]|uniref:GEVED domain-containing protein n=1 Tax=Fibrella aquatica TaxID=3242487 RepID=UPI0035210790